MFDETTTVGVTVLKRDPTAIDICVKGVAIGTITVIEESSSWELNETGANMGLEITPMQVSKFISEALPNTLVATVERQLLRIGSGGSLTDQDRNLLNPELQTYLNQTTFGFLALRHPLVYVVPYCGSPMEAVMANARLEQISEALEVSLRESDWSQYVFRYERPYRLEAFGEIVYNIDDDVEYWELLSHIWTDSENIYQNLDLWLEYWASDRAGREHVMNENERSVLAFMPDKLTIYRGTRQSDEDEMPEKGMSWTLSEKTARWFGNRYVRSGYFNLLSAEIAKTDVLALLLGRNEEEIVVLPDNLRKLRQKRIKVTRR